MAAPDYSASDFERVIHALMPRGLVWPSDPTSVQGQVIAGLAPTWQRHTVANNQLLVDAFPATAYELLPEWESTLGLPDPCAGVAPTVQQRRNQVVARLTNSGGQSIAYFVNFAQQLGFDVQITQFAQARVGVSRVGDPLCGHDWNFAWKITAPLASLTYAVAGGSAAGDPLVAWGNEVLECEFRAVMPAHTIPIFAYGQPGMLDSTFIIGGSSLA